MDQPFQNVEHIAEFLLGSVSSAVGMKWIEAVDSEVQINLMKTTGREVRYFRVAYLDNKGNIRTARINVIEE